MATALIVIDVQKNILARPGGERPVVLDRFDAVRARIAGLVDAARHADAPVIFIQHDGAQGHRLETGLPGWEICEDLGRVSSDTVVRKAACDSFYETDLQSVLARQGITHLMIVGLMTQYCVDTTCRRAVSLGYDVTLVADGHTTGDSGVFTVEQLVEHHNALLDGFSAGAATISVMPAKDVTFVHNGAAA
ncbi:cysteine hydrolase family protein [Microvirga flavescens]|uniref:cysteine hydrolase family protein n=1 Tax=Microvirga flavescens TaxID=2249811 RepID=UPI000DD936C5|nr:cysteine hydrolase family protein [Microvirga flavescens]